MDSFWTVEAAGVAGSLISNMAEKERPSAPARSMSLLKEIQEAAVAADQIAVALRKAKILASRLSNEPFKEWIDHELNGYPDNAGLPEYRVIPAMANGNFVGFAGSGVNNAPIPAACLPERYRDFAKRVFVRQGLGAIESVVGGAKQNTLYFPWPADLVVLVGKQIYRNMSCMTAQQDVNVASFVAIVDSVRSKLLDFILEIERANPEAGEARIGEQPVPPERVAQIFNQKIDIRGGSTNIATGSAHFTQNASLDLRKGDLAALTKYLESLGVLDEDIEELNRNLTIESAPATMGRFGPKVADWVGKMVSKAASGAWEISVHVAGALLTDAIKLYYGLSAPVS